MIYQLKGHNESQLPSDISDRMKQQNLATEQINLLNLEQVPEDAAAVMLVYPQKDLTEHETQLLQSYLDNGGKLMLFGGLPQSDMTNLSGILSQYGLHSTNGFGGGTRFCPYLWRIPQCVASQYRTKLYDTGSRYQWLCVDGKL